MHYGFLQLYPMYQSHTSLRDYPRKQIKFDQSVAACLGQETRGCKHMVIITHAIYTKKEPASKTSGGNIIYGDASNYSCWVYDERHISDKTRSVTTKQKTKTQQTNYQDLPYWVERTVQTFTVMKQLQR